MSRPMSTHENICPEKCYEGLGCVRLTNEWTDCVYRPYNLLPAGRHAVNTIFVHWSLRMGKITPDVIGTADLKNSGIQGHLKLLIHDFTSNGYTGWIEHLALGLLTCSDCEGSCVVSVDWAAGAEPPYVQAVANARLVALEIVLFLNKLKTAVNINAKSLHIIGHGLGAHIAGYVGKMIRLRKITALDPSGPFFKGMPPNVKLYKGDADFVEVIHTDATFFGQGNDEITGHVDFFANGGRNQPQCQDSPFLRIAKIHRGDLKLGQILPGCSHKRSLKYYIESLFNPTCSFIGIACSSYRDFMKGLCVSCGENNELCFRMHPLSVPKKINSSKGFYFITSSSPPFCTETLLVTLELDTENSSKPYIKGFFNVTIPQSCGDVNFLLNENGGKVLTLKHIRLHTFLVMLTTPPLLRIPVHSVHVSWIHANLPCCWIAAPKISYLTLQKISDANSTKTQCYCAPGGEAILDGKGICMKPCDRNKGKIIQNKTNLEMNKSQGSPLRIQMKYHDNL